MRKNKIFLLALFSFTWISQSFAIPDWYIHPASYTSTNLKGRINSALHTLTENQNASFGLIRSEFDYLKENIQDEISLEKSLSAQPPFLIENEAGLYTSV